MITEKPTIANTVKKFHSKESTEQAIRELIEHHVTEALEEANKKAKAKVKFAGFLDNKTILNAYPLENIK